MGVGAGAAAGKSMVRLRKAYAKPCVGGATVRLEPGVRAEEGEVGGAEGAARGVAAQRRFGEESRGERRARRIQLIPLRIEVQTKVAPLAVC